MNKNEEVIKIRDHIYDFLHFDKLTCHILSEYYNDLDMILEFELSSDNEEISFCIMGNNLEIIWDESKSDKYEKINELTKVSNKYEKSGNYIVRIKGELLQFSWCSENIKKVINWNHYLEKLNNAFQHCSKLEQVPNYISSNVQNMSLMFYDCSNFNSDISEWNVSNVQDMHGMFYKCHNFNFDLSKWNVSNVQNMSSMFFRCKKFNSDISNWNVSNVQNMLSMFYGCKNFDSDISKWDVSSVKESNFMFYQCNIPKNCKPKID